MPVAHVGQAAAGDPSAIHRRPRGPGPPRLHRGSRAGRRRRTVRHARPLPAGSQRRRGDPACRAAPPASGGARGVATGAGLPDVRDLLAPGRRGASHVHVYRGGHRGFRRLRADGGHGAAGHRRDNHGAGIREPDPRERCLLPAGTRNLTGFARPARQCPGGAGVVGRCAGLRTGGAASSDAGWRARDRRRITGTEHLRYSHLTRYAERSSVLERTFAHTRKGLPERGTRRRDAMARRRYVSIKEVAARAGVSFQTASKVLNGGDVRVSVETEERILAAAAELGYRPNTIARSLVQRASATIGLVASDATDVAIAQASVAAEQAARRNGHSVLVGHLAAGGADGADIVRTLIERRVDGIIAAAPEVEEDTEVADLLRRYVPSVSLQAVPGGGVPLVGSNHRETGRLAATHLLGLGHTSIGTVTGTFRRRV